MLQVKSVSMATLLTPPRELPVVAGHLALDFVNTVDDPEGQGRFDHLHDVEGLVHWASRLGLLDRTEAARLRARADAQPRAAMSALRSAHALRDVLDQVFRAVASASDIPDNAWHALRRADAAAMRTAELTRHGDAFRLAWPVGGLKDVLHPVAHHAVDLLGSPELVRIKTCAGCPWLYLDRSRNGSRRWCSMDDCGRHEKIRLYVARRAQRRRASRPSSPDASPTI